MAAGRSVGKHDNDSRQFCLALPWADEKPAAAERYLLTRQKGPNGMRFIIVTRQL